MFKQTLALFGLLGLAAASPAPAPASQVSPEKRDSSSGQATYFEVGLGACGWTNGSMFRLATKMGDEMLTGDRPGHDCRRQLGPIRRWLALREMVDHSKQPEWQHRRCKLQSSIRDASLEVSDV
jgi:hypothetical protein